MRVGLFIPCYVDQFFPSAGMATVELLENHGCDVAFPEAQTCCGQPMANAGCSGDAAAAARHFVDTFSGYDYVVSPSGSCVAMVKHQYPKIVGNAASSVVSKTYEICEFLLDVVKVTQLQASCSKLVAIQMACHGTRELRLATGSERPALPTFSKPRQLLEMVDGMQLVELQRPDECCGFGGLFSIDEVDVSCAMGDDKLSDFQQARAELVVSTDMSCLMHLGGLSSRQDRGLKFAHIAEVLNGDWA
ncbi:MAG TPA: Fe-S oxidoreductase [Lentisphaeria bacterium]|nr:Fe-S oxidoreductase [Lentisphaeria bacterium]